jgi:hypothetical protein
MHGMSTISHTTPSMGAARGSGRRF